MRIVNEFPNRLRREARRLQRETPDAALPAAQPLIDALRTSSRRRSAPRARAWHAHIETERRRLRASHQPLSAAGGATATLGEVTRGASVPPRQATLLFDLAASLGARRCLELGTGVGISGAYLAAAMETGTGGRLVSLEGHRDRADVARATWRRLSLEDAEVVVGRFERTLPGVLDAPPFDLVHLDGHHDRDATLDYIERIRATCRPGTLLVVDDIDWSPGMRVAWSVLQTRLADSTISDLGRVGLIRLAATDAGRG